MYISADTADGEIFIYVQEYLEANAETDAIFETCL